MGNKKQTKHLTEEYLLNLVRATKPDTVEELTTQAQLEYPYSKPEIMNHIMNLHNQGKLTFKGPSASITLRGRILSSHAQWYWLVIALSAATTILVFTASETTSLIDFARYVLGSIFVLFLPGYSLIKALSLTKELNNVELVALSVGMSVTLVSITGLVLNYTPWGMHLVSVIIIFLVLTITFSTVALLREHQEKLAR